MGEMTPMMQQYLRIHEEHKDCILFFRIGDFYEMFFDDAVLVSRELELTLTGKDCGMPERAPMCGVPYHAVSGYVARLLEHGHKVAICEQLENPQDAKGLVKRDVIRIITPGTIVDASMLDEKTPSYLLCVYLIRNGAQLSWVDVSTGEMYTYSLPNAAKALKDEVMRIHPSEIITNDASALNGLLKEALNVGELSSGVFESKAARQVLCDHFSVQTLSSLGLEEQSRGYIAAGALLRYLTDTQKNALNHITGIRQWQGNDTMYLDAATRRNLEITQSLHSGTRRYSLLWLLDKTHTAMGARLLRSWVESPLTNLATIQTRLNCVLALKENYMQAREAAQLLDSVADLERLLSRISYQTLNARDCLALLRSLRAIGPLKESLSSVQSLPLEALLRTLTPMQPLCDYLEAAINPDAPLLRSDGNVIRSGFHAGLDEYRSASENAKQWLLDMETRERELTGIKNLRIQYNRVFGYYLEVTKSNLPLVPERYHRKQTLAACERYTTPELSELEAKITGAWSQALALEEQLFCEVRSAIEKEIGAIQQNALVIKTLDALLSLAQVADENRYVMPKLNEEGRLYISQGRHPIVEKMLPEGSFVPNDTLLDTAENRMLILTGPNMAGKSTYMRQTALITLMAHIGSFVPADEADISLCDRIFTRIGASDDLAGGQSTFMLEMSETAAILQNATQKSLVILDEIGRGTGTFDGLSIAWAVVEYLLSTKKIGCKTLFATHYHELSELEGHSEGVKNYCISVAQHGEDIVFLRKIIPGGADKSYGVEVARLAGIPKSVISRAHEIQARLEVTGINRENISSRILGKQQKADKQTDLFHLKQDDFIDEVKNVDVYSLTPMDALNLIYKLREEARDL